MDPSVRFDVEPPKNTTWNWKGHIHFTTRMKVRKTLSLTGTELDSKHWFNVGDYTDFDQIKKSMDIGGVALNLIIKVIISGWLYVVFMIKNNASK